VPSPNHDAGIFERLATAVLRHANHSFMAISPIRYEPEGKTVKSQSMALLLFWEQSCLTWLVLIMPAAPAKI